MNGDYSAEDVLTAADVPGFPQGTATIYRVTDDASQQESLAALDARGFLRSLDDQRGVFYTGEGYVVEVAEEP